MSPEAAHAAITAAGGRIVKENDRVGVATVRTNNPNFAALARQQAALFGVARNRQIGQAPPDSRPSRDDIERLTQERLDHKGQAAPTGKSARPGVKSAEPLASLQWDMAMIHATVDGSYRKSIGDRRVLVGVIDTGIDGSHPDIAPNFNQQLSRNFTTDIPLIDGPCEYPSCVDPANEDDDGHGTHVAGTIAAALNGLGIAGVAPGVTAPPATVLDYPPWFAHFCLVLIGTTFVQFIPLPFQPSRNVHLLTCSVVCAILTP